MHRWMGGVDTGNVGIYSGYLYSWLLNEDNSPWWQQWSYKWICNQLYWSTRIPQRISDQMNSRNKWNKIQKMQDLLMIRLRFNRNPPTSSATALTPVDLHKYKDKLLKVRWCIWKSKHAQNVGHHNSCSLYGKGNTIAGISIVRKLNILIWADEAQGLQRKTTWGLFATKDEAWACHRFCRSCDEHEPSQNIPQKHRANGRQFGTQALFFFRGIGGHFDGAPFASLHFLPLINHYFSSLFYIFVFLYFSYTC